MLRPCSKVYCSSQPQAELRLATDLLPSLFTLVEFKSSLRHLPIQNHRHSTALYFSRPSRSCLIFLPRLVLRCVCSFQSHIWSAYGGGYLALFDQSEDW